MKCYTYVLKCSDGSLYTGWTNDLNKRLKAHNEGKGAKYTRGRTPADLVYLEEFDTKEAAMKREAAIKKMSRAEKLKLPGMKV
ncbi:GIY-YIG nuclease family protein [Anaerostipes sp.]|uniref:GIY-YIG nuclease family protein n=1 Tax=Anaerostipes sp. TaxID=1872530 RepID=UPI0025C1B2FD|nr:GIY-YIG nuclease family protein [Anaerostipes sp.]MBS7008847.1 GIY-YIG nuclease family protein [Anaerostipes sp.]